MGATSDLGDGYGPLEPRIPVRRVAEGLGHIPPLRSIEGGEELAVHVHVAPPATFSLSASTAHPASSMKDPSSGITKDRFCRLISPPVMTSMAEGVADATGERSESGGSEPSACRWEKTL